MNYTQPIISNFPYSNPVTKLAMAGGLVWLGFVAVKYSKAIDKTPAKRRERKGFTTSKIDHDLDHRNKYAGRPVPSNPDVPFYSRHNYNRRRRSKNFW